MDFYTKSMTFELISAGWNGGAGPRYCEGPAPLRARTEGPDPGTAKDLHPCGPERKGRTPVLRRPFRPCGPEGIGSLGPIQIPSTKTSQSERGTRTVGCYCQVARHCLRVLCRTVKVEKRWTERPPEGIGKRRFSNPKVSKMSQKGAENDPNGAKRVPK